MRSMCFKDSGTRYTSHNRMDDTSYRKPESSYGSSRDHSHHRSEVDIGRKRMRSDSYSQSQVFFINLYHI